MFPSLLKKLLEKDYGDSIRSGFQATGIFPFNPERVLAKLPTEQREVDSAVQQQLLNRLSSMRYSPAATSKAPRPKKKDKLPPGASYTCTPEGGVMALHDEEDEVDGPSVPRAKRARRLQFTGDASTREESSSEKESSSDSEESSSDSEERSSDDEQVSSSEELGAGIRVIVENRKKKLEERQNRSQVEQEDTGITGSAEQDPEDYQYLPESFVVVLYERDWYLAQVLDKDVEPEAESGDGYVFLNFMKKTHTGESFQWPSIADRLNVLKEDILFVCDPPVPSAGSSSSRKTTFSLSKGDLKKAKAMLMQKQAYYLIKTVPTFLVNCVFSVQVQIGPRFECSCWCITIQFPTSTFLLDPRL